MRWLRRGDIKGASTNTLFLADNQEHPLAMARGWGDAP